MTLHSGLEAWGLRGLLAGAIFSFCLLALAVAGLFQAPFVALAAICTAAALLVLHHALPSPSTRALLSPRQGLALAGVFAATAILLWPPGEFVLGGLDPGVYFNAGASLAREAGFVAQDSLLLLASEAARQAFTERPYGAHPHLQPGFYWDEERAGVSPQFPFLLTVWSGLAFLVAGPMGSLFVPVATGLVALFCFFLFARRLLGPWSGLLATALLASNGVFLWHSRSHYSEPLLLAFLLGGLWAGLRWQEEDDPLAAPAAGLALGLLPLIKTEGVLLGPMASGALLFMSLRAANHYGLRGFLAGYLIASLLALVVYWWLAWPVFLDQAQRAWGYPLLALGAAIVAGRAGRYILPRLVPRLAAIRQPVLLAAGCAFALLAGAGCLALGATSQEAPSFPLAFWQGSFLSPLDGLALMMLPFALVALPPTRPTTPRQAVFLLLLAGATVYLALFFRYYLTSEQRPLHMWADRRLLPIVLPALALAEAWAISRVSAPLPSQMRLFMGLGMIVLLLAARGPELLPLITTREYRGALHTVQTIAGRTEAEAVVLLDNDATGIRLAAPLRFLEGRAAYINWHPQETPGLRDLVDAAQARERPVYYLSSSPSPSAGTIAGYQPALVERWQFALPELERTSQHRPREQNAFPVVAALYRLGAPGAPSQPSFALPLTIDVGLEELTTLALWQQGLLAAEATRDGATYRWTTGHVQLMLPSGVSPRTITLRAAGGRPERVPPAVLILSCSGTPQPRLTIANQFATYVMPLGPDCHAGGVLTFEVTTWSPGAAGLLADARTLGIMVDWVRLE